MTTLSIRHHHPLKIIRRLSENIEDLKKGNPGHPRPDGYFHGVPDIIVEILSPSNRDYDFIKKKDVYKRFGVKEYWIVDPDTKETWAAR